MGACAQPALIHSQIVAWAPSSAFLIDSDNCRFAPVGDQLRLVAFRPIVSSESIRKPAAYLIQPWLTLRHAWLEGCHLRFNQVACRATGLEAVEREGHLLYALRFNDRIEVLPDDCAVAGGIWKVFVFGL